MAIGDCYILSHAADANPLRHPVAAVRLLTTTLSGSGCGLAVYTQLPNVAWRFEQLANAISARADWFTHCCGC